MSLNPNGVNPNDPFVADRLATVAKRFALLDLLDSEGIKAVLAESEEEWRTPPQPPEPDPALATFRENRSRHLEQLNASELARLAQGALLNMQSQRGVDLSDDVSRVICPVLIVHGDADTTVPLAFGQALAAATPNAELAKLVGTGHGLIVNPEAQQIATSWLRQLA